MNTRITRPLLLPVAVVVAAIFSGCADDAEPATIEKPAIVGVATGDIATRKDYVDTIEANNKRNAERGARGDWSYVKPAVGPKE